MGGGEIAIIVVIAVLIVFCAFLYVSNSKKIKQKAKAEKEKAEKEKAQVSSESKQPQESTEQQVKKIVEENSIAVENYIKDTLLKEELEAKERNQDIKFEEVSETELLKPLDNGDYESGAIILGKKQTTVHTFAEDYDDDENNYGMNTINITNELDAEEEDIISSKHKKFDIERSDSEVIDKTVSAEINDLSKSAKAVIISGLFDKVDD